MGMIGRESFRSESERPSPRLTPPIATVVGIGSTQISLCCTSSPMEAFSSMNLPPAARSLSLSVLPRPRPLKRRPQRLARNAPPQECMYSYSFSTADSHCLCYFIGRRRPLLGPRPASMSHISSRFATAATASTEQS